LKILNNTHTHGDRGSVSECEPTVNGRATRGCPRCPRRCSATNEQKRIHATVSEM